MVYRYLFENLKIAALVGQCTASAYEQRHISTVRCAPSPPRAGFDVSVVPVRQGIRLAESRE